MTQMLANEIPSYMDIATEGPYLVGQNWSLPQLHPMAPIRGRLVSQTTCTAYTVVCAMFGR